MTPPPGAVRLGILSDTHDRPEACRAAVEALIDAGAEALVHCGDVGEESVLDVLAGHPAWFVWGNTDVDRRRLALYARDLGLACLDNLGRFQLGGRQFVVTHGDDSSRTLAICRAAEEGQPAPGEDHPDDYLLTGHTHVPHDHRRGSLRWINPGALHRTRRKTVALLEIPQDRLRFIEVDV